MASKSLKGKVLVADVVRLGDQLTIPDGMSYTQAIELIQSRAQYDQKVIQVSAVFDVFPWDGCAALRDVLEARYGWAQGVDIPPATMFDENRPPNMVQIDVDVNKRMSVPWGRFSIQGTRGWIQCEVAHKDGHLCFGLKGECIRQDQHEYEKLFELVRDHLARHSIYRGKAVRLRFSDDDDETLSMPRVNFIDTSGVNPSMAIYTAEVAQQIQTSLFTPISRASDCLASGIPLKRGVLFVGTFGTGKTLASLVASKLAVDAGITFVHVQRASELAQAISFARQYQSPACVVFCEDIDREVSGERSVAMDDILNIVDGIDSKSQNIIVVLTSNDVNSINPAMLRPGRLDAVIEITPPDAEAVERLIRLYAGDSLDVRADLTAAGEILKGNIPATIAEVVKRAKLAQLARQPTGSLLQSITGEAIVEAARSIQSQVDLMERLMAPKPVKPALDEALRAAVNEGGDLAALRADMVWMKRRLS